MLGRDDHIGGAEERIRPRGVDPQDLLVGLAWIAGPLAVAAPDFILPAPCSLLPAPADEEIDLRAAAPPDPVPLEHLDAFGPVESREVVFQPIGVGRDPQHPLPQRHAHHGMAAAFAQAADHFLVGQHRAQGRAPIDGGLDLIGQPLLVAIAVDGRGPLLGDFRGDRQFGDGPALLLLGVEPGVEEHQEDELRPAEVGHVGRGQLAVPVIAEAQHLQLPAEGVDVALGRGSRMGAGLLGVLLGGQPEGVPAHGVHDAVAPVAAVAADDIGGGVAFRVADVQAGAAGIGEHVQDVHLGSRGQAGGGERAVRFPVMLPFRFDRGRVIAWHVADSWESEGKFDQRSSGQILKAALYRFGESWDKRISLLAVVCPAWRRQF